MSDILAFQPTGTGTSLGAGLDYVLRVAKRKAVTFLISDFLDQGYERPLQLGARRHDLIPVVISDPLEEKFPSIGLAELEDPETGERMLVDTSDPSVRRSFERAQHAAREQRIKLFKKLELDHVELRTGEDYGAALVRFFRRDHGGSQRD